ncbi:MAG: ribose-phosphate pyrophosphokinase [archaeon]
MKHMRLITGSSNPELGQHIADFLKKNLTSINVKKFADGEIYVRVNENIRGNDVFIVQSTITSDDIMELLIIIDAAKRASADKITVVIPYFGYARQDRKANPREPITAKLIANLLTIAGANRVLTVDLHAPQIQGFFDIPLDDTWAFPLFVEYFKKKKIKNLVVVSPDAGGVKRALHLSKALNSQLALIDKRRVDHNKVSEMNIIGDISGKNVIIYDDIIDTGGTICKATEKLMQEGAKSVYICATHPVFSGDAISKLQDSCAKEVLVTNTIPVKSQGNIKFIDIAPMLALAMKNIHKEESVSTLGKQLFKKKKTSFLKR